MTHRWKSTNHHQEHIDQSLGDPLEERFVVEGSIWEPINLNLEEKLHNHCVVNDQLNKCLNSPKFDLGINHVTMKEGHGENNHPSLEGKSCERYVVEINL